MPFLYCILVNSKPSFAVYCCDQFMEVSVSVTDLDCPLWQQVVIHKNIILTTANTT